MTESGTREWKVQFMVPEAEMSGLARYLSGAWMVYGGGVPGSAGQVGSLLEGGMRLLYNGLPISGMLSATGDGVRFEPSESLFEDVYFSNRPSLFIPRSDMVEVKPSPTFLGFSLTLRLPAVVITTTNGKLYVINKEFLGRNSALADYIKEAVGLS